MIRITVLLLLITTASVAQNGEYNFGSKSAGMADASITTKDPTAIFNNPGALGAVTKSYAFVSYQNRYSIKGFQVVGGGANYYTKHFNLGMKYFKFGDELYNQQLAGLVIANKFQMVSLGLGVNVIQTFIESLDTQRKIVFEFGGLIQLTDNLSLGTHIFNLNADEGMSSLLKAGLTFTPIETLQLNLEVKKPIDLSESYHFGMQYALIPKLFFRAGLELNTSETSSNYINHTFGIGINIHRLTFDYALVDENPLGCIHDVTLAFNYREL